MVNPLTDKSFYVLGNNLGTTGIALFDQNKQLVGTIDVEVTLDTDQFGQHHSRQRARRQDQGRASAKRPRPWLSGEADDAGPPPTRRARSPRAFPATREVINSVNISSSQQVQLNVRLRLRSIARPARILAPNTAPISPTAWGGRRRRRPSAEHHTGPRTNGEIIGSLLSNGPFRSTIANQGVWEEAWPRQAPGPRPNPDWPVSGQTASFLAGGEFPDPGFSEDNGKNQRQLQEIRRSASDFTPDGAEGTGWSASTIAPEVSSIDASASL